MQHILHINHLVTLVGPKMMHKTVYYSYECPYNRHDWGPDCHGKQLNTYIWSQFVAVETSKLNKVYYLLIAPYKPSDYISYDISKDVGLEVELEGRLNSGQWKELVGNTPVSETTEIVCFKGSQSCEQFVLVYEDVINYNAYRTRIKFTAGYNVSFIGDVEFTTMIVQESFARMAIGFKVTYMLVSVAMLLFWVWILRSTQQPVSEWFWEQRTMLVLGLGLICFNEPFYALEYLDNNWFLVFLNSLLELVFYCTMFLFWLFAIDKIRMDETTVAFKWLHAPKVLVIFAFSIFSLILYTWSSVREKMVPVFSISDHVTGIQVIYSLVGVLFVGLVLWLSVLIVLAIPTIVSKPHLKPRFYFFAIPTGICVLSVLVGIFNGTVGPFGRDALGTIYFLAMFNSYVYLMMWGFWPITSGFIEKNPQEGTNLFGSKPYKSQDEDTVL